MRRQTILVGLATLAAIACTTTEPRSPDVLVYYRLDGPGCTTPLMIDLVVDGDVVDSETVTSGQLSRGYAATKAEHTLAAHIAHGGRLTWGPDTYDLSGDDTFVYTLPCPFVIVVTPDTSGS